MVDLASVTTGDTGGTTALDATTMSTALLTFSSTVGSPGIAIRMFFRAASRSSFPKSEKSAVVNNSWAVRAVFGPGLNPSKFRR